MYCTNTAMGLTQNKALIFSNVPFGYPIPGKDITVEAREIDLSVALPTNSVSVKNYYASFDPFMRGMLRAPEDKAWVHAYTLREPVTSITVSKVINSLDPSYKEGDLVIGINPIEEYSIVSSQSLQHLQNPFNLDLKLFLGALGMPGQTAYASFYEIGKPTKGETILISAASGAVGQIVGQLAKREGLRVVGSVGSKEKLDFILKDLGFDDGFNYKVKKPVEALKRLTAADTGSSSLGGVFGDKGVDIYFDNVGGEMLEAAIGVMNVKGRIGRKILT
jgi:NADPH-dependent curcumin reductase CurA